jgi:hypothetical protein
VTQLLRPPAPIRVEADGRDRPRRVLGEGPPAGDVEVVLRWIVEVDWWSQPVSREYWRVVLDDRLMCEIYRDRAGGGWYLERVYD